MERQSLYVCMRRNPKLPLLAAALKLSAVFLSLPLLAAVAQQCRCYCDIRSHVFGCPLECAIPTAAVKFMTSEPKPTLHLRPPWEATCCNGLTTTDHNVSIILRFITPNKFWITLQLSKVNLRVQYVRQRWYILQKFIQCFITCVFGAFFTNLLPILMYQLH